MISNVPQSELPLVIAVVLNWNGWRDTLRCLDSLNGVEYPRLSVLVVDNHSIDDSVDVLRAARPDMEVLIASRNGGYAAGMNIGIARAFELGADYVWALNNDIVVRPNSLQASLAAIAGCPDVGVVGSTQVTSATPWVNSRPYPTAARHRGRRDEMVVCMGEPSHPEGHDVDFVSGAALLLRSEMLRQVGWFDESYFHYAEEVDLCERANLAGWKSVLACGSQIWHARGGSLALRAPEATYYAVRNQLRLERRLYGRGVAHTLVYRPRLALHYLLRALDRYPAPLVQARAVFKGLQDAHLGRTGPLRTHSSLDSTGRRVSGSVRVLFVAHSAQLAGAERSLLRLLARLNRDQFEPIVLLPGSGPFEDRARDLGVQTVRAHYSWWLANRNGALAFLGRFWWSVLNMPALIRTARTVKPDVIYTNSLVVPQGALLAKIVGVPHIWHVREVLPNPNLNTPLSRDFVLSLVVRLSSSIVVVSESSGKLFDGHHGTPVRVVYNGVDQLAESDGDQGRAKRMKDGAIRLAVVGTMSTQKRTLDAIKAVEILREFIPAVHLVVVGGGGQASYRRAVNRYVASHGLSGNVVLLGERADVITILAETDVLIMPGWPEAFGLVTVEALSVGTPVVGASTTGTSEILRHGGGVLVEPGRPELIADAVRRLVATPEHYLQARRNAHTAAGAFTIDREITLIEREILSVLGGWHEA